MAKVASGQTMRSAERLLQVLNCFGGTQPDLSISEISRDLELAPATVRRLLVTLSQQGFVRPDEASGRYRLDFAVISLAAAALAGSSLVKAAGPVLDALCDRLDEAVQLSVRDGGTLMVIDHRQSGHLVKTFHSIGHCYAGYKGSAPGKVLLASLSDQELNLVLPSGGNWAAPTERGIGDAAALKVALARTRERGYGLNEEETEAGVWAAAAAVRDHRGQAIAAINVPCPTSRLSGDRRQVIIDAVVAAGVALSAAAPFLP